MRHGGRRSDEWKCKLETADEQAARQRYQKLYEGLRQGQLQLIDPEGKAVESTWAPRIRLKGSW